MARPLSVLWRWERRRLRRAWTAAYPLILLMVLIFLGFCAYYADWVRYCARYCSGERPY